MTTYIGTKIIKAKPMTKQEYCDYRGWKVPEGEDPKEEVYLVEYAPDPKSKPNHKDHKGYISMSPKFVFDKAYKICETEKDKTTIELSELQVKTTALATALTGGKVPAKQVAILSEQLVAMNKYAGILERRLA